MLQIPRQPLTIRQVFSNGLELWRVAFPHTLFLLILFLLWLCLPYFWLVKIRDYRDLMLSANFNWPVLTAFVFYLLGTFVFYIAFFEQTYSILIQQHQTSSYALLVGFKKLFSLIAATIISAVAVALGCVLITVMPLIQQHMHSVVAIAAGYLLLIIPGVYLTVVIQMYYPLIIIDDINPITGFKRFCELIWGNWWRTLAIVFIPPALFWLLGAVIHGVAVVLGARHLLGADYIWILQDSIQTILGAVYLPVMAAIIIMQLLNLKARHERKLLTKAVAPNKQYI